MDRTAVRGTVRINPQVRRRIKTAWRGKVEKAEQEKDVKEHHLPRSEGRVDGQDHW